MDETQYKWRGVNWLSSTAGAEDGWFRRTYLEKLAVLSEEERRAWREASWDMKDTETEREEDAIWERMKEALKAMGPVHVFGANRQGGPKFDRQALLYDNDVQGEYMTLTGPANFARVDRLIRNRLRNEFHFTDKEIASGENAARREIKRKLAGSGPRPLEQSPRRHRMGASAKRVYHMERAASAASRNNGNADRPTHLTHEQKIVAAKAAIAAYARDKKLPSAEQLAAFRELDEAAKAAKPVVAVAPAVPGGNRTVFFFEDPVRDINLAPGGLVWSSNQNPGAWIDRASIIERDNHSLSSEALGRAADQLGASQSGRSYADLVGTREQRLAEVLDR
jgi:hypothetical protein